MRLCYTWRDCFSFTLDDLPPTDIIEHPIVTKPRAVPIVRKPMRYSPSQKWYSDKVFGKVEAAAIISRGDSPYGAWTMFVRKLGEAAKALEERTYRVVHDFRPVNADTVKSAYPYHNIETNLNDICIGKPTYYSKTDAKNGYWAIPIRPGDEWLTGFISPIGLFCYRRTAQGLKNVPMTYARFGDLVFGALPERPGPTFRWGCGWCQTEGRG